MGTKLVKDIGPALMAPDLSISPTSALFFVADDGVAELWKRHEAGTKLVKDILAGGDGLILMGLQTSTEPLLQGR
jgi:ELWxxDGT repeat protein